MLGCPGQGDQILPRSLNGIIEQMEKFSSSLNELSSRVEASHLTMAQERELGIQQRDQQLRGTTGPCVPLPLPSQWAGGQTVSALWAAPALQERLGLQQRDMEEERSRLQMVIGKMEARLSEQSRLLEQVGPPSAQARPVSQSLRSLPWPQDFPLRCPRPLQLSPSAHQRHIPLSFQPLEPVTVADACDIGRNALVYRCMSNSLCVFHMEE